MATSTKSTFDIEMVLPELLDPQKSDRSRINRAHQMSFAAGLTDSLEMYRDKFLPLRFTQGFQRRYPSLFKRRKHHTMKAKIRMQSRFGQPVAFLVKTGETRERSKQARITAIRGTRRMGQSLRFRMKRMHPQRHAGVTPADMRRELSTVLPHESREMRNVVAKTYMEELERRLSRKSFHRVRGTAASFVS